MRSENVPGRQLAAWVFVAMTAPLSQITGGGGWLWVTVTGLAGLVFYWLALKMGRTKLRWLCAVQWLWAVLTAALLCRETANSWPMGNAYPIVPLAVLAMAAWAAQKGVEAASGASSTLLYIVALGLLLTLVAALGRIEWTRELEQPAEMDLALLPVFLLPCAAAAIPGEKKHTSVALAGCFVLAALCAVSVQGVLSVQVMEQTQSPFVEMSRGLKLLGMWERFEALVCAVLTVGWFALLALLLCAGSSLFSSVFKGRYKLGVWVTGTLAAGAMLCNLRINPAFLGIFGVICWGVLPIITQGIGKEKKV